MIQVKFNNAGNDKIYITMCLDWNILVIETVYIKKSITINKINKSNDWKIIKIL